MKRLILLLFCTYVTTSFAQFKYPSSKKVDSTNTYLGVTYHDQYQWIENLKDTSVVSWFHHQADYSNAILNKLNWCDEQTAEWNMTEDKSVEYPNYADQPAFAL